MNSVIQLMALELNQLHRNFKSQSKTDLFLLDKIRDLIEEIKKQIEIKPMYFLPLEGIEKYLPSFKELDSLKKQKSLAVKNKDFERAANLRDDEKVLMEELHNTLAHEMSNGETPFFLFEEVGFLLRSKFSDCFFYSTIKSR